MKIFDENRNYIGELERPKPVEQNGVWYESNEYRNPKGQEYYFGSGGDEVYKALHDYEFYSWIASPIPKPTPEQLKAIGMKFRDERPTLVKKGDYIWSGELLGSHLNHHGWRQSINHLNNYLGHFRWVLVPDEGEKKPCKPTDTELLDWAETHPEVIKNDIDCWWAQAGKGYREKHFNFRGVIQSAMEICGGIKQNDSGKPAVPDEGERKSDGSSDWICPKCNTLNGSLNKKCRHSPCGFEPRKPAEPRFTVEEFDDFLKIVEDSAITNIQVLGIQNLRKRLVDPEKGIKAVTERNKRK